MREVSREQVVDCLQQVGVSHGDGLLVHSALQFLGQPEGGTRMYLDVLGAAIGLDMVEPAGTLAVPAFNFSFALGEDFDPELSPAVGMGTFSEFIRQQPNTLRTTHPLQSFALIGSQAEVLSVLDTPSAFDDGSAVDEMVKQDFKLLLLGANIQAVALLHYVEQRVGVPYRFWKTFKGRVKRNGKWQDAEYKMYVRDMVIDARLEIFEIEKVMKERGLWHETVLNYGKVSACRMSDFAAVTSELLSADPWRWVTNPPEMQK